MKKICTLLMLFSIVISYSQNVTLLKNFNPRAQELKHDLNTSKDSLIFVSDKTILKVDLFNEDYESTTIVNNIKTKISLNELPVGKFIVEATLVDKILIMHVIKHSSVNKDLAYNSNDVAEGKGMMLDEELQVIKSAPKHSIEFLLTGRKKKSVKKSQKLSWSIIKTNNEIGSSKTMKLVTKAAADRMVSKNKYEQKSVSGQSNQLTIWEVYDTSKFMEHQMSNPDFVYTSKSDFFNTMPYFSTPNREQSL